MIDHALQTNSSSGADTTQTIPNRQASREKKPETSAFCGPDRTADARSGNSVTISRNKWNLPRPTFPYRPRRRRILDRILRAEGNPAFRRGESWKRIRHPDKKRGAPFGAPRPFNQMIFRSDLGADPVDFADAHLDALAEGILAALLED